MNNDEWAGLSLVLFFLAVLALQMAVGVGVVWAVWTFITWIF